MKMGMVLTEHFEVSCRLILQLECTVCEQPITGPAAWNEQRLIYLFGATRFNRCPVCGRFVEQFTREYLRRYLTVLRERGEEQRGTVRIYAGVG
jgi:hypothetical protein